MYIPKRILSFLGIVLLIGVVSFLKHTPKEYNALDATINLPEPSLEMAIQQGFQDGRVEPLFPFFDELISICVDDVEEIYLAYNAKSALQNFFNTYPPATFQINHRSKSKGGKEIFFIGDYKSQTDEAFRIYIFAENELIESIEIAPKVPISS